MKYTEQQIRSMVFEWLVNEDSENDRGHGDDPKANENYRYLADDCVYSIIESYTPDSPGWCGDILTVVFGYDTCFYVFRVEEGKLTLSQSEGEAIADQGLNLTLDKALYSLRNLLADLRSDSEEATLVGTAIDYINQAKRKE